MDFPFLWTCSFGSARAVNRRYISDCVPVKIRMQASAGFVSASAFGVACGPALAGLLQTKFRIYNITFNQDTLPGWVMALAWFFYLIWLWISFREPAHEAVVINITEEANAGIFILSCSLQCLSFCCLLFLNLNNRWYIIFGK